MVGYYARMLVVALHVTLVERVRWRQNSCCTAKDGTLYSIPLLILRSLSCTARTRARCAVVAIQFSVVFRVKGKKLRDLREENLFLSYDKKISSSCLIDQWIMRTSVHRTEGVKSFQRINAWCSRRQTSACCLPEMEKCLSKTHAICSAFWCIVSNFIRF